MASYIRRDQEWVFQVNQAAREIIQTDKQIIAAEIRLQMAQKELENHLRQIQHAEELEQFLKTKFSNTELYQWMKEQMLVLHRQTYQLAFDMTKKAEKALSNELGRPVNISQDGSIFTSVQPRLCRGWLDFMEEITNSYLFWA